MSELSQRIARLSPEKLKILAQRLNKEKGDVLSPTKIKPQSRDSNFFPLSFAQQRLWFLDQLESGNTAYNLSQTIRLVGKLNVIAFQQSLNEIVRRHEVLRTTFITIDGQPQQAIASFLHLHLPIVDLGGLPEKAQEQQVQHLATAETMQPFLLAQGPLLRVTLLKLGVEEHVVLVTMHHIISDGWSIGVLIQELATIYTAFDRGKISPLPELPIQYVDFTLWQQEWLQKKVLADQLHYWQKQLTDAPVLQLPTDRPRSALRSSRGATQSLVLAQSLSEALKVFSLRSEVTLFMTLLAAFQTLLYRYTSQEDICVGSPIANRNRSETEQLIGFFVNTLVLRTNLGGNPQFPELLQRVREVTLGAYAHQDLPFEQLVEVLQPQRDLSYQPLFQVMFVLQNSPESDLELPGLSINTLEIEGDTALFDLTLSIEDSEQGLVGALEYNTDLFDASTITRMLSHFQTLLEAIALNPQQKVSDLPLLSTPERHQLLRTWNENQVFYPQNRCIHHLFEAQVEQTPDAVAVVFESHYLTYQELNQRSNCLAHHLKGLGVGPEVLVGLCIKRSIEMLVAILAILKVGGAYLPLDPVYPQERLAFMLTDTQAPVLLTQKHLLTKFDHDSHVVCIDTDWQKISQNQQENLITEVQSENLAYVIYTSGSTGRPKGVTIEHRNAVLLLDWAQDVFTKEQLRGVLASTSICFDLSIFELFVPLSCGGKVILAENALHLPTLASRQDVTLINTVPSILIELLRINGLPESVSVVNLAGEPLQNSLVQQIYQRETIQQVFNLYGPSEDTTYSTFALVKKGANQLPSIGYAIANKQTYVLDNYLQPVPIGVPGQLYLGGAGLARGYLTHPQLTAEKFIPNPFSQEQGTRLYKTGDLVRYLSDGQIEYLGRLDHQVKIRGFRIEIGEVEAALSQYPDIQQAVVMAREDIAGNKRLVAYITLNQGSLATGELLHFLKAKLPEYMLPSFIVPLKSLPLNPNGKVDRHRLPAPDTDKIERQSFTPPRNNLELQLAYIWEDILDVRPIGIADNFFNLGGHSLLVVRLMAQIHQQLGQKLPLAQLFQAPTIEQLANTLRQPTERLPWSPVVAIQPSGSKKPFFCIPGGGGYTFYLYHLARYLGSDQPFYGLQARGLDGEQEPHTTIEAIAAYNLEALRTIQPQGPYLLGGHSFGGLVAFEMALQLQKQGEEVALLALMDTLAPIPGNKFIEIEQDDTGYLVELASIIESFLNKQLSVFYDALQSLSLDEQLNYVLEQLKTVNFFAADATPEQLRGLLKVFKAQASGLYLPQEVYPNKINLFRTNWELNSDPTVGWDQLSRQPIQTYTVAGEHVTMMAEPHVQVLAKQLKICLDRVQLSL
ncbi:amino acid adenylation domain-containing protein [Nostoc flagelliforme FACHB-838]|uniref:Amino acid adenylation domain-containing protein n=1 Tax=Nostoc flagelliforme FACHB-838 TaxID=2692904 RepID=A0ABR8DY44_9NOSO|nr:amino acid adenylation domain-containing protein [Nostoc flagelliforme]MBD2533802.1 amino acid adenylation domain-containing protein [Nostoc flagelliforme FACHB-838]